MEEPTKTVSGAQLELTYGFGPPAYNVVEITTDQRYPVENSLYLNILNPSRDPVVTLDNPTKLTPTSDLPPVDAQKWPVQLDRFYIWFPWGPDNGDLTTADQAAAITVSPAPDNTTWYTQEMSDPDIGRYWILFPKDKSVLDPQQNVGFVISGIVTEDPVGSQTVCYVRYRVTGYDEGTTTVNVYLAQDKPDVTEFDASPSPVDPGAPLKITWFAKGANECTIEPSPPGGTYQGPGGNLDGSIDRTTTFTLQAKNPAGTTNTPLTVYVNPVELTSFTATPAYGVRLGQEVELAWVVDHALDCTITPTVGSVGKTSGSVRVTPGARTVYTLTVSGEDPKTAETTVFPIQGGWSTTTQRTPWSGFTPPVMLAFPEKSDASQQMWLMAADNSQTVYASVDGAVWNPVTSTAQWPGRTLAGGAVLGGKMWLMGGKSESGDALNDVWSSADGVTWEQATSAATWPARTQFCCLAFQEKLWVFGGFDANGNALHDVWSSSDGVTWKSVGDAQWQGRGAAGAVVYGNRLWILGGRPETSLDVCLGDVWSSSDGSSWDAHSRPPWSPRCHMALAAVGDALVISAGTASGGAVLRDLWTFEEESGWTAGPGFGETGNPGSVGYQEALWIAGGITQVSPPGSPVTSVYVYAPDPVPGT